MLSFHNAGFVLTAVCRLSTAVWHSANAASVAMCGSRTPVRTGGPFACIDGWAVASPTDGWALERADDRLWLGWGRSVPVAWHPMASAGLP